MSVREAFRLDKYLIITKIQDGSQDSLHAHQLGQREQNIYMHSTSGSKH